MAITLHQNEAMKARVLRCRRLKTWRISTPFTARGLHPGALMGSRVWYYFMYQTRLVGNGLQIQGLFVKQKHQLPLKQKENEHISEHREALLLKYSFSKILSSVVKTVK